MIYNIRINDRAFNAIMSGSKRVEIRVTTNPQKIDYNKIRKRDILFISNTLGEKLRCIVTDRKWYETARALLTSEGTHYTLSSTDDIEEGIKRIESFKGYKEGIVQYGVNAIHLQVIWQVRRDFLIYYMKLNTEPYELIKFGKKNIEMRLMDEKREKISIGDNIIFTNINTGEQLKTIVLNIFPFKNFEDLYRAFDKKRLGYSSEQDANPSDMEHYYKKEEIDKYGVVGIEIDLVE